MQFSRLTRRLTELFAKRTAGSSEGAPFSFDPRQQYLMPAHFGPTPQSTLAVNYPKVTTLAVSYLTDRAMLSHLLPPRLSLAGEPELTVYYSRNEQIDWLAGGAYNLLGINVQVKCSHRRRVYKGAFCLVLWENNAIPITYGRELLGVPKIFAEIDDHVVELHDWRTRAHLNGAGIIDLEIKNTVPSSAEQLAEASRFGQETTWLGWRYVPRIGAAGAIANHPTTVRTGAKINQLLLGEGCVNWHEPSWNQNPTQFHIIKALHAMPVLSVTQASVTTGSTWLFTQGAGTSAL